MPDTMKDEDIDAALQGAALNVPERNRAEFYAAVRNLNRLCARVRQAVGAPLQQEQPPFLLTWAAGHNGATPGAEPE